MTKAGAIRLVLCPYCRSAAELVGGLVVYPHRPDLRRKQFWLCRPCKAWVGCHAGGVEPLGRLADTGLRRAKREAHEAFDPLWHGPDRKMSRTAAYAWLSKQLGIPSDKCHIGMFDVEQCEQVVSACRRFLYF